MMLLNLISDELTNYESKVVNQICTNYEWDYDTLKIIILWKDKEKRLINIHEVSKEGVVHWNNPIVYDLKQATLENTWDYQIEDEEGTL